MLNAAIEDGLMASNPAAKFGRILKLTVSRTTVQEQTEAMKKAQRQLFLATASHESPRYYPPLFVLVILERSIGNSIVSVVGYFDEITGSVLPHLGGSH